MKNARLVPILSRLNEMFMSPKFEKITFEKPPSVELCCTGQDATDLPDATARLSSSPAALLDRSAGLRRRAV